MPDVVIVTDAEIRHWFGLQLTQPGPNGKRTTQSELGEKYGVSGSTISRNRARLYAGEPLSGPFREKIEYEIAAQKLDARARWHLEQLRQTHAEEMARAVAEHEARLARIETQRQAAASERQAKVARLEAQRRAKEKRRADLRAKWNTLDAARPSWIQAGRLPLLPSAGDVQWFSDALRLETRMTGEELMQLDDSLMGWSDTWTDDVEAKRTTLDILTARARRRYHAARAMHVGLASAKWVLWLGFKLLHILFKAVTSVPTVLTVLGLVAVAAGVYARKELADLASAALTSIVSVIVLLVLTATLFACVPIRARGEPESPLFPLVFGGAFLSLVLLIITAVSWLLSGGLSALG